MPTKETSLEPIYRVRFDQKNGKDPVEVTVKNVYPSDLMGLVTLEDFIFSDHTKKVILPEEEEARRRFSKTNRLHVPYHQLIFVEELKPEPTDVKNLPFMREVPKTDETIQ